MAIQHVPVSSIAGRAMRVGQIAEEDAGCLADVPAAAAGARVATQHVPMDGRAMPVAEVVDAACLTDGPAATTARVATQHVPMEGRAMPVAEDVDAACLADGPAATPHVASQHVPVSGRAMGVEEIAASLAAAAFMPDRPVAARAATADRVVVGSAVDFQTCVIFVASAEVEVAAFVSP